MLTIPQRNEIARVKSAVFEERKEGLARDSRAAHERVDDTDANVLPVARHDKRSRHARLFQFDVAAPLAHAPVSQLFKYTDNFPPRQRS